MSPRDDSPGGDRGSWGGSGRDRDTGPPVVRESGLDRIDHEKLEILDGSRSKKPDIQRRAAARIEDLTGILQMPRDLIQSPKMDEAGPGPTAVTYNQLQQDVILLHRQLMVVADALRKRLS